jgi:hypothetical protein
MEGGREGGGSYLILGGALLGPDGSSFSLDSPLPLMRLDLLAVLALLHVRLRFFCSFPFPQPNDARTSMCVGACVSVCRGMCVRVSVRGRVIAGATHRQPCRQRQTETAGGERHVTAVCQSVWQAVCQTTNNPIRQHVCATCLYNVCVQRACVWNK